MIPAKSLAVPQKWSSAASGASLQAEALTRFQSALERELQQLAEDLKGALPVSLRMSSSPRSPAASSQLRAAQGAANGFLELERASTPKAGDTAVDEDLCEADELWPVPVAVADWDSLGDIRLEEASAVHESAPGDWRATQVHREVAEVSTEGPQPMRRVSFKLPDERLSDASDQSNQSEEELSTDESGRSASFERKNRALMTNFSMPDLKTRFPEIRWSQRQGGDARRTGRINSEASKHSPTVAERALQSHLVNIGVPVLILLSALSMGFEAHWAVQHPTDPTIEGFQGVDMFFTACFTAELVLRIMSEMKFFMCPANPDFQWNLFDTFVVFTSLIDLTLSQLSTLTLQFDLSAIRLLRMLRLTRVIRVIRLMRFFRDLRVMVAGVLGALRSLLWAMVLLLLMMFMFAVVVMQVAADELGALEREKVGTSSEQFQEAQDMSDALIFWYGSLFRSLYTLYMAITGGVDWIEPAETLVEISPALGAAYCLYIAFGLLCVLNIVTGVFVDNTNKMYSNDEDQVAIDEMERSNNFTKDLKILFEDVDEDGSGTVTKGKFRELLKNDKLKAMLRAQYNLNIENQSSSALFDMFDLDGDGLLDIQEFIYSVQRFHGSASSIDLARVALTQRRMRSTIEELSSNVEKMCNKYSEDWDRSQGTQRSGTRRGTSAPDTLQ